MIFGVTSTPCAQREALPGFLSPSSSLPVNYLPPSLPLSLSDGNRLCPKKSVPLPLVRRCDFLPFSVIFQPSFRPGEKGERRGGRITVGCESSGRRGKKRVGASPDCSARPANQSWLTLKNADCPNFHTEWSNSCLQDLANQTLLPLALPNCTANNFHCDWAR